MTLKECEINKSSLLIMAFILIAHSVNAQVSSNTIGEIGSDRSENKYGQFILEIPFGAKLFKNNCDNGKDLLDNIKNSCSGKAIFLDIWATWCSPCLEAMPSTKRLHTETKDLPVEFIYICTDLNTNIDNWITKVSILRQPGIHIFVENEIINEMMNILFKRSDSVSGGGFPVYLFIDKNGQFEPEAIPLNTPTKTERLVEWIRK